MKDGGCLKDHFESYRRQTGRRHKEDSEGIKPPAEIMYLWGWFQEITRGRPVAATGQYLALPSSEILAWCTLKRVRLDDWELDTIRALDSCFLRVMGEKE